MAEQSMYSPVRLARRKESLFSKDRRDAESRRAATAASRAAMWGTGDRKSGGADKSRGKDPPTGKTSPDAKATGKEAKAGPLEFKATAFSATGAGSLNITDKGTYARVASVPYRANGTVEVVGGTDTEAADWEAGFMQTVYESNRKGHYKGDPTWLAQIWSWFTSEQASGREQLYEDYCDPCPVRDGDAGVVPVPRFGRGRGGRSAIEVVVTGGSTNAYWFGGDFSHLTSVAVDPWR